jgi:hypothetical protein
MYASLQFGAGCMPLFRDPYSIISLCHQLIGAFGQCKQFYWPEEKRRSYAPTMCSLRMLIWPVCKRLRGTDAKRAPIGQVLWSLCTLKMNLCL